MLTLAVKGNTLYADSWSDLVTLDISNPQSVVAKIFSAMYFPIAPFIIPMEMSIQIP